MRNLRRLALAAVVVAFGTVILGSWTRINGAGETCPDWPLCNGKLIPSLSDGTVWEWLHRMLALVVAPLVIALIATAWRNRARSRFISPTAAVIAALFAVQVLLGAATVELANSPLSVVLHWGTAMALIAALSALVIFASLGEGPQTSDDFGVAAEPGAVAFLAITAAVTFATMCLGAYVSSSGAGLACLSLPACAGSVVVYSPGQIVQTLHRVAAALTMVCAAGSLAAVWARPASSYVRGAVTLGVVAVSVQVLLGLLNVALRLPTDLREAHAVNAALTFLIFVAATVFALVDMTGNHQRTTVAARR